MTNEEKDKLILDNTKLIYYVINKHKFFGLDLYDAGLVGLIKAANTYNEDKGTFSNYAYTCIYNELVMYIRENTGNGIMCQFSKEDTEYDLADDNDNYKGIEEERFVEEFIAGLNDEKLKFITERLLAGKAKGDICKELNVSRETFRKMLNRIRYHYIRMKREVDEI